MALTITAVGSLAQTDTGSSLSFTTLNVGDCVVVGGETGSNTELVTGVSDTNGLMTWATLGQYPDASMATNSFLWIGTVTATGATTIQVTVAGSGTVSEMCAQEFQPSVTVIWGLDGSKAAGQFNGSSSTTVAFPTFVPSTGGPELFVGYGVCGSDGVSSTPTGFTFTETSLGNLFGYGTSVTGSITPDGSQSPGSTSGTFGALVLASIPSAPTVANEVGANAYGLGTSETLSALVTPGVGGGATIVSFNYGPTSSYGSSTGSVTLPVTAGPTLVRIPITGLTNGTTYHFQCVATNSVGTTDGSDTTFTTATYTVPTATDFPGPSWFFGGPYDPDDFLKRYSAAAPAGNVTAPAGDANVSAQADNSTAQVEPTAGVPSVGAQANQPGIAFSPSVGAVSVGADNATSLVEPIAGAPNVSAQANNPTAKITAQAGVAGVSVTAEPVGLSLSPATAPVTAEAFNPTATSGGGNVTAPAGLAGVSVTALGPTIDVVAVPSVATVTSSSNGPGVDVVANAGVAGVVISAENVEAAIATAVGSASVVAVAEAIVADAQGLAGVAIGEASAFTAGVAITTSPSLATVIAEALNISRFVIVTPGKATISVTTPSASIDIAAAIAGLTVETYLATLVQTVSQATVSSSVPTASIVLEVLS